MSSGIKATDSASDRFSKILPADVTAAFLSVKLGLEAAFGAGQDSWPIVYSFIAILAICPFYFAILMSVTNKLQNAFLCLSFVVFGISIASVDFINVLPTEFSVPLEVVAIALPIIWAFLIAPMFLSLFGNRLSGPPGGGAVAPSGAVSPVNPANGPRA